MNETQATLDALKAAQGMPLEKSWTQPGSATSGLATYDLEAPAKNLFPILTPIRNMVPREVAGRGIQANWRAITGINSTQLSLGVPEGRRPAEMSQTTADYIAVFKTLALGNSVTFQADMAAQGFQDLKATAVSNTLQATMIQEEQIDLAGNTSLALGTTPTPTLATATTGGSLPATTAYSVICVALTQDGYQQVAGLNNGLVGQSFAQSTASLVASFTRTDPADGSTYTVNGGVAQKSAAAAVTTGSGSTNSITATVTAVVGAVGYAWFFGVSGSEFLTAVTSLNSVSITAVSTSTLNASTLPSADKSTNSLVYDGIMTQILKSGSGSYVKALATGTAGVGTALTSDGAGGVVEIEDALSAFYNNYRLSPEIMFVSANVNKAITKLIVANNGAPIVRFTGDFNQNGSVQGGSLAGTYLNKTTGSLIKIMVHPNAAPGTILFFSNSIPYPLSGVGAVLKKLLRTDYRQNEWPLRTYKYEYSVMFDGVLQNYFPPAFGLIYNIAA